MVTPSEVMTLSEVSVKVGAVSPGDGRLKVSYGNRTLPGSRETGDEATLDLEMMISSI